MPETIYSVIARHIPLSSSAQEFIGARLVPKTLHKGAHFLRAGEFNNKMAFLESGLLRSYYFDEEGREHTTRFVEVGGFFTDLDSFQQGSKSERSIEALLDCQILVIDKRSIQECQHEIESWDTFEKDYISNQLMKKIHFQRQVAQSNSQKAYETFLASYPGAARYAPRYQIASFLGLSPFSLSRIKIAN